MWTETTRSQYAREGRCYAGNPGDAEWRPIALELLVGSAGLSGHIRDRDGAPALPVSLRYRLPWLRHIFADGAYAGPKLKAALEGEGRWRVEVVGRARGSRGFQALPRRRAVERTPACMAESQPTVGQGLQGDCRHGPEHGSFPEASNVLPRRLTRRTNNNLFRNGH